jgi:HD-GYP domain-containing protein (c-di-GMP phosphodiesterase class II)/TolA-binding protein
MNLDLALKKYERMVVFNPKDGDSYFALALLYDAKQDGMQAAKTFQSALEHSPKSSAVRFFDGSFLARFSKKLDLAVHQWEKAIELEPSIFADLEKLIPEDVSYPLKEKLAATVEVFEKEAAASPGSVFPLSCQGFAYGLCKSLKEGISFFDSHMKALGSNSASLYLYGLLLFMAESWDPAARTFEKVLENDKTKIGAYYFLSLCYLKADKLSQAVRCLEKLKDTDPSYEKGIYLLAEVYLKLGRYEQAVKFLQQIIQFNPQDSKAHFMLGQCYQELYRLDEAEKAYKQSVQLQPEFKEPYFNLGMVLTRLGKWNEAIGSLKEAAKLSSKDPSVFYHLGLTYNQTGSFEEAIHSFQEAISIEPVKTPVDCYLGLALAYEKIDNLISAIDTYKKVLEKTGGSSQQESYIRYHLSLCYQRLGEYSLAMEQLEEVLKLNPQDGYAAYNLGSVYAHLALMGKAQDAYSKACELNPNDLYAHFNLGGILARDGFVAEANEQFKKALELTPKNDAELALYSTLLGQMAVNIEIAKLNARLKESYFETVKAIIGCLDAKDKYTAGHTNRVSVIAAEVGKVLNLSKDETDSLAIAAVLHDIGKVGVPDAILLKQGKLTAEEFQVMKEHPVSGAKILEQVSFPWTQVVNYVKHHHERYDGSGYPDGLKGEEIPIGARILSVSDFFDALATERPYKKAYPIPIVLEQAEMQKGKSFDPDVIAALKKAAPRLEALYKPAEALTELPTWESSLVDSA